MGIRKIEPGKGYTLVFKIVDLDNGNLDVFDENGYLMWENISKEGFRQILVECIK